MKSRFQHSPAQPTSTECQLAFTILCNAHEAASSFMDIFDAVRKSRKAVGASTDEEQDLLRASLVFACAGLDSMIKQLVRDALPTVIDKHPGSHLMLQQHVERVLKNSPTFGVEYMAEIIVSHEPRALLINRLIGDLTSGSVQSAEEVMRIGAHFDIPSKDIVTDVPGLKAVFGARNQIVHEMDVDFKQVNRNRRPRSKSKMTEYTSEVFKVASAFLSEVELRAR
jgi:hypothetical protein